MSDQRDFVAVFDSGVGGISVLRQLRKVLPNERYLYYGDSINAPYGTRSVEQIRELTLAAAEKIIAQGVKAFVIACNTATSAALEALKEKHPEIIVVGIEPAVALAAKEFPGGKIGVMATPATLKGKRFLENKAKFDAVCSITPLPAPGLMELVEAGKSDTAEADVFLKELLKPYLGQLDALVLGCTHYPFVENALRRVAGENVKLFDGAVVTAQQTKDALEAAGLLHDGSGEVIFQNSLPGKKMLTLSRQLAGME